MLLTNPILIAIAAAVLLLAGCSGGGVPEREPADEPTLVTGLQTGIPPVDAFLGLVALADIDRIATEAALMDIQCEADRGIQDHPLYCEDGEPDGTVKQVIMTGCAPYFSAITKDDLPSRLDWLDDSSRELEAVFETDAMNAAYALVFIKEGLPPAPAYSRSVVYLTDDGRLSSYAFCGEFTEPAGKTVQLWP